MTVFTFSSMLLSAAVDAVASLAICDVAVRGSICRVAVTAAFHRTILCYHGHSHCRCSLPPPAVAAAGSSRVTPTHGSRAHRRTRACTPAIAVSHSVAMHAPSRTVLQRAAPAPARDDLQREFDAEKARAKLLSGAGRRSPVSRASQSTRSAHPRTRWCNGAGFCSRCGARCRGTSACRCGTSGCTTRPCYGHGPGL
jgi:hypothetical protein